MFPPGQPQPLQPQGMPGGMQGMPGMGLQGMPGMQQPPASPMDMGQPAMPQQGDPNAILAALMGGNDALGNNLLALFQARQQNPNAAGSLFSPYEPPPQQSAGDPMSMMQGLPF